MDKDGTIKPIEIAVCIATYKRHAGLRRALDGLVSQCIDRHFAVVLANNDIEDKEIRDIVNAYNQRLTLQLVDVCTKGVSAVRNEAIAYAYRLFPALKWIAFQDDDETAAPNWLLELISAGEKYNADLVGGYTEITCENTAEWAELGYGRRSFFPNGPVKLLNGANNLLISSAFLKGLGRSAFRIEYGLSGGEDYEFFRFSRQNQAVMIWSNDAKMYELWPGSRMQLKNVFLRNYRKGVYMARVDVEYDGQWRALLRTAKSYVSPFARLPRMLRSGKGMAACCLSCINDLGWSVGRINGHFGKVVNYYGSANVS